ncbi:MAG: hypothetical protein PSX36_06475, partial [bacterium]|nr:hypothetical protein [bacterium]
SSHWLAALLQGAGPNQKNQKLFLVGFSLQGTGSKTFSPAILLEPVLAKKKDRSFRTVFHTYFS